MPVKRLDDCLEEWGVESVDLMKMDVEGHEPFVLRGAPDALASGRIRAVLVEFNDHWLRAQGSSPDELNRIFREAGYVDTEGPAKFLPRCAGGVVTAFALTEADVGSDPARMRTTASVRYAV